jgi:hypothetical protein
MNLLMALRTSAVIGVNLHAILALVLARGKAAPALPPLARRSALLAFGFIVLSGVLCALSVQQVTRGANSGDPVAFAGMLARQISEGINCAAFSALGALLPVFAALWLSAKAALHK